MKQRDKPDRYDITDFEELGYIKDYAHPYRKKEPLETPAQGKNVGLTEELLNLGDPKRKRW